MFFLPSFLSFLYSIALLCSVKKSLNRTKIAIFHFNQKSEDKSKYKKNHSKKEWFLYLIKKKIIFSF